MSQDEFEIPDSDDLPEETHSHHGQPHTHRHTEGFPAHSHAAEGNEAAEDDGMRLEGHDSDRHDADERHRLVQTDHLAEVASGFADVLRAHNYSTTVHSGREDGRLITATHADRPGLHIHASYGAAE